MRLAYTSGEQGSSTKGMPLTRSLSLTLSLFVALSSNDTPHHMLNHLPAHPHACMLLLCSCRMMSPQTTLPAAHPPSLSSYLPSPFLPPSRPHRVRRIHVRPVRQQHLRHLLVAPENSGMKRRSFILQ